MTLRLHLPFYHGNLPEKDLNYISENYLDKRVVVLNGSANYRGCLTGFNIDERIVVISSNEGVSRVSFSDISGLLVPIID